MGAVLSSVVDENTKREMEELVKAILKTFTTEYVKAYGIALVNQIKDEGDDEPSEQKLEEREPWKENRLEGWLKYEGGFRNNTWKRAYFVVRHDYFVDYYATEEEAKKENGKKRGTMALCGYNVIDDVNNGLLIRLKRLAEKLGIDVSQLPQPKEYPEFTLEVHHDRRRTYFLTADNKEEFRKWVEEFQTVVRRVWGLRNKDPVHEKAFHTAVRKTRWSLGRWGWWSYGGSEEQILSDLIVSELDYDIMSKFYSKIPAKAPNAVKLKIRDGIDKFLDRAVMLEVTPAWALMSKTVEELRPKIEPVIKTMVDPLGKLEAELVDKIREAVMGIIGPLIAEHITPHIQKPIDIIRDPLRQSYEEARRIYVEHVTEQEKLLIDEAGINNAFRRLDWIPWSWEMWRATEKFDVVYDLLWDLRTIFTDIYPWSLVWKVRDTVRKTTDNAIYTYEKRLKETEKVDPENSVTVRNAVLEDFVFDSNLAISQVSEELIKDIIMPPFNAVVRPACKAVIEPLASAIPENMQDFVDINKLFDDVVDDIIHHSILVALGDEKIEAGGSSSKGKGKEKIQD